jgi:pimeloyl-ACP methyl ester carboxylesterase
MPTPATESETQIRSGGGAPPRVSPPPSSDARPPTEALRQAARGRILVLPGVYNTRLPFTPLARFLGERLPNLHVDIRPWGTPLRPFHNLAARARNLATAERIAREVARWRVEHAGELLYVIGFSGGGGLATLVAAALPTSITIDRLILVAPAISPNVGVVATVLPHVREFIAVFTSARDLQVGWGTRVFGTIDRVRTASAGAIGFPESHPRLLQWSWSSAALGQGHHGNHLSYLRPRWQRTTLWPAIDPATHADALRAQWAAA